MTEQNLKHLKQVLADIENSQLGKVRNVALDVVATMHMQQFYEAGRKWECICPACESVRSMPRLAESIQRAITKARLAKN